MSSERTSRHAVPSRKARSSASSALAPQERAGEPGERRILDRLDPALAPLRREIESHLPAHHLHVVAPDRRQPERAVLLHVALRADPEEPEIEEPHRARQHPLASEAARDDVSVADPPHRGETPGQPGDALELLTAATGGPVLVIQVLLPPGGIGADRLEVSPIVRTDPHVLPGGRDGERPDPFARSLVPDGLSVRVEVGESTPLPAAGDPGRGASHSLERAHRSPRPAGCSSNVTSTCSWGRARCSSA